jgi:cytochrome c oxidase subunit 4
MSTRKNTGHGSGAQQPESGLKAFIRYYIWLPAPAADLEKERQQKAARAEARRLQQVVAMPSAALQGTAHGAHGAAHTESHPPYLQVFGWLIILTAIEVFPIFTEILFGWTPVPHNIWIPVLLVLAVIKATLVAMYYMHLKYDQPWLVWVLIGPLAFAMFFGFAIVAS